MSRQGSLRHSEHRGMLFPRRKRGVENVRRLVLEGLRPTGNVIQGYTPSAALQRSSQTEE